MTLVVLGCLVFLALIGHGYFWIGIVNRLHAWPGPRFLIDYPTYLALLAFVALPLLIGWRWLQLETTLPDYFLSQAGILPRYAQFCIFWGITCLLFNWRRQRNVNNPSTLLEWRQEKLDLVADINPPPARGLYAQLLARIPGNQCLQLSIDHKRLAIPQLQAAHAGLKIAHLSDLHITGRIDRQWFDLVFEQVNKQVPDVIAITGDIVERETCWSWLGDSLGKLRAKYGVYFILGNHDFFIDVERTRQELVDAGLIFVGGRWIKSSWNDCEVKIAGNERPWGTDNLDSGEIPAHDLENSPFRLVLAHTPDQFGWCCQQGADLVLAGHTHGGQIRFPLLGAVACPSYYGTRYACGVFRKGDTVMHVSRGISGETPFRWDCLPEIALIELASCDT